VNRSKSVLAALALTGALGGPCPAQVAPVPASATVGDACAEYFGCLHYGTLTQAQARTARGHPEFVEVPPATASQASAPADQGAQAPGASAPRGVTAAARRSLQFPVGSRP
jgi:hypothetical protein